jgi:hypothetical protein
LSGVILSDDVRVPTAAAMKHFYASPVSTATALAAVDLGVPPCWKKEVYSWIEWVY